MIHEQTHRATFIEIGTRLLEQGVDGEFEIEFLDFESVEGLGQSSLVSLGLRVTSRQ